MVRLDYLRLPNPIYPEGFAGSDPANFHDVHLSGAPQAADKAIIANDRLERLLIADEKEIKRTFAYSGPPFSVLEPHGIEVAHFEQIERGFKSFAGPEFFAPLPVCYW
ncbi:MAG TPA: hypothetical protein VEG37_02260 [Burkholderiales bacterium]|nr:hypothetical protein [Burkholderiales bacterium]